MKRNAERVCSGNIKILTTDINRALVPVKDRSIEFIL